MLARRLESLQLKRISRSPIARKAIGTAALAGALVLALGAGEGEPLAKRVPADCAHERPLRTVLIVIDGVRYQDIFEGSDPDIAAAQGAPFPHVPGEALTPKLHELIERGVALGAPGHGAPFMASGPNFVSLPGYSELLQGRPARCTENDCSDTASFTLLDGFAQTRDPASIGAITSWTNIERVAASPASPGVVSAGRTGGYTRDALGRDSVLAPLLDQGDQGAEALADPAGSDYRSDDATAALALAFLDEKEPPFLFVSLGDTDEHAHRGDYLRYLQALGRADAFVGEVMKRADRWRAEGVDTMILVTADHGRSADFVHHGREWPESARSFLIAAGGPIPAQGYVGADAMRYLRDVAPTVASLAGVPIEVGPTSGHVIAELAPQCVASDVTRRPARR